MSKTIKKPDTKKVYIFNEPYDSRKRALELAEKFKNIKPTRYDIKR